MSSPSQSSSAEQTFPWGSLPPEVQLLVLEKCDLCTLANLCGTDRRHWSQCAPMLWRTIDFQAMRQPKGDDAFETQRAFLVACDWILDNMTERGRILLSSVRVLRMLYTPGFAIPRDGSGWEEWTLFFGGYGNRALFEVLASFTGLEELQIYVKESFDQSDSDSGKMKHGSVLQEKFPSLTRLVMGGEIPQPVVLALLSYPEKLERLSCIALQDGTGGQGQHSGATLFFRTVQERLTNLRYLHLCKMAELTETLEVRDDNLSGLYWNFDYENEDNVLREWSNLFQYICSTLEELELEHCYVVHHSNVDPTRLVHADEDEPQEWGESSSRRFREIVVPALAEIEWTQLRRIRLVGVMARTTIDKTPLKDIQEKLQIDCLPARVMRYALEVTPLNISPPNGPFSHNIDRHGEGMNYSTCHR